MDFFPQNLIAHILQSENRPPRKKLLQKTYTIPKKIITFDAENFDNKKTFKKKKKRYWQTARSVVL